MKGDRGVRRVAEAGSAAEGGSADENPRAATSLRPRTLWAIGLAATLACLLAFQALIHPRITDPDAFYHIGHAAHYLDAGPLDRDFPWTAWSAVSEVESDLWYGLHLLAAPFAASDDPAAAIRPAAVVLALAGVGAIAWVAVAHGWVLAPIWPVLFLLAVPNALYRYLSLRPEVLSIPFAVLLLSALARRRALAAALAAFGIAWVHVSMLWLIAGCGVVAGGAAWVARRWGGGTGEGSAEGRTRRMAIAVVVGTLLGILLRPNPFGSLELAWIQIAELLFEKTGGAPLTFATELSPIGVSVVLQMAWPLLTAWAVATVWGTARAASPDFAHPDRASATRPHPPAVPTPDPGPPSAEPGPPSGASAPPSSIHPADREFFLSTTVLALGFLVLTLFVARRSLVYWTAFALPAVAIAATVLSARRPRLVPRLLLASLVPLFAWSIVRNDLNARFIAIQPDRFAAEAAFLSEASEPGDLVFNTHWDAFGPLFARNRTNRYLGGMDPIFQYAADARRYWMFHHLSTGVATAVTCPLPDCGAADVVDVWEAVRGEFGARWLLAEPARDRRLIEHLDRDVRFRRAFEGRDGVVFEVAVAAGPASPQE